MEYPKFKVTVSCMTYNQSKYITDAMNGFTMQQTSFPFVCTVVDDASTDGEQEVIRKYVEENFDFSEGAVAFQKETDYAHITYAQHKANKNCYFAVLYLKENHYSQNKDKGPYLKEWRDGVDYMAICEGDDYWIVPDKLEIQAKFLDENEEYVMVHTDYDLVEGVRNHYCEKYKDGHYLPGLFDMGLSIGTLTTLFRLNVFYALPKYYASKPWLMGDYPLWIELAHEGRVKYIQKITSKYRVLHFSASHSNDFARQLQFINDLYEIGNFYADKYGISHMLRSRESSYYLYIMKNLSLCGVKDKSTKYLFQSIRRGGFSLKVFAVYICVQFPVLKRILNMMGYKSI